MEENRNETQIPAPEAPAAPVAPDAEKSAAKPRSSTPAKAPGAKSSPIRSSTTASRPKKKSAPASRREKPAPQIAIRSERPAHRVLPYLFLILAAFLLVTMLLNLFCNLDNQLESNPSAHWMGKIGYHICYLLFGTFGGAIFALPILLINLAFYWKKYIDNRIAISKLVSAALFQVLLSAVIHVICLAGIKDPGDRFFPVDELLRQGAQMRGGGIVGGSLGYLLTQYLNIVGSSIVGFLLLAILLFYFLGMTPHHLWARFRLWRAQKKEQAGTASAAAKHPSHKTAEGSTDPEDDLAPMPTPRISPDDEEHMFLPPDVHRRMKEEEQRTLTDAPAAKAAEPTPAPTTSQTAPAPAAATQTKPVAPAPEAKPAPAAPAAPTAPSATAAPTPPRNATVTAQNRDAAVDPIFPRTVETKQTRRIPKEDRSFDLKKVFIDFDDEPAPVRKHAPLPPEHPMPGTRPQPRPQTAARPAPAPTAAARPSSPQPARMPNAPTAAAPQHPTSNVANASGASKPIFRAATAANTKEFGLSSEEFEKLEANRKTPDLSGKKPAAAPAAPIKKPAAAAPAASKPQKAKRYTFPPISYLHPAEPMTEENKAEIGESMQRLAEALESFRVRVQEINYSCGPTVTRYEVILAPGVRVRSVTNLANDIALALRSSGGVRIEAPIPGTNAVGIEVPNKTRSTIYLRDMIESKSFVESKSKLSACLGADIAGAPIIFDISKMPHLLVAGTTGSGKSVCINCIIMSILYKARPDEVKLILIDPKKVEFSIYKNIPHLMAPVVTAPKDAAGALQAAVEEMEHRFEMFESVGVRDLKGYQALTKDDPDMPSFQQLVIIIDELADLMMTAKNEVETAICRIAQKARAAGIHLIIGTQRPSVDVVTGLIKANVPSSIAFAVKSQMDSRVILDHGGAEALTGRGDMLFVPIGSMRDTRVQGAFVDDKEVERICEFIRVTNGSAIYDENFTKKMKEFSAQCNKKGSAPADDFIAEGADGEAKDDPKYIDALRVAIEEKRASTSLLQRKLGVGYSRAAKLVDRMEADGYVGKADGSKPREILITPEEFLEKFVDGATANGENAE